MPVESEKGEGTSITIFINRPRKEILYISVVIAEDDPMVAHINRQYISRFCEMTVLGVFSNGQDAWGYISKRAPELLILDVYMPQLSGMDVLHKIRTNGIDTEVIHINRAIRS